jgi:superfamily II DNA/RNA helicase
MSRETLQRWLLADRTFSAAFDTLEADAVRAQFPNLQSFRSPLDGSADWPYLLFCASILAPSNLAAAEEKALRIAQSALTDDECLDSEKDAALILLDALSNRRSIELAEDRGRVKRDVQTRLGMIQKIDWLRRSFENRIELSNGRTLFANRFQRRFWDAAQSADWVSVSAPTSAGKSFILAQWLGEHFANNRLRRVVYVAPTRALVQQVDADIRATLLSLGIDDVEVSSIPWRSHQSNTKRSVMVFTQERFHYYMQSFGSASIDALVIDEAHKVGDSHRGILLQDVVEQAVLANPAMLVLFTAPLTENPESLLADAPPGATKIPVRGDDTTVNQNLIWIEPAPEDPKVWHLILRRGERGIPLGYFETSARPSSIKARLATLAILTDTGEGGVLVYANGAARAEEIAAELADRLPDVQPTKGVRALDELCRSTIHEEFRLRGVLRKGVAFHYGNMPLLLRTAIEEAFRAGDIRYLVCTSTLVEGVNLPCKSIIIHAPKKGGNHPMEPADFWNLAGRAGRWGQEFQGNVICVDTQDVDAWGLSLPTRRGKYRVERTTDRLLRDETRLIEYIEAGAPSDRARSNQDLETAVSYLATVRRTYGSLADAPWSNRIATGTLARVDDALSEALSPTAVPDDWLRRHAGISPFAMRRMINALLLLEERIEGVLPIEPEEGEAAHQYGRIFEMIGHNMTTVFGQGSRCLSLGILTTNWMLGYPMKRIISERIQWHRRKKTGHDTAKIIRDSLEDVEQIARFQAPRYLACYGDIARFVLNQLGTPERAEAMPDLTLSLEFGVRGPVQLALMSLGLSRSSTLAIADAISSELDERERNLLEADPAVIAAALRRLTTGGLNLPTLISEEVESLRAKLGPAVGE